MHARRRPDVPPADGERIEHAEVERGVPTVARKQRVAVRRIHPPFGARPHAMTAPPERLRDADAEPVAAHRDGVGVEVAPDVAERLGRPVRRRRERLAEERKPEPCREVVADRLTLGVGVEDGGEVGVIDGIEVGPARGDAGRGARAVAAVTLGDFERERRQRQPDARSELPPAHVEPGEVAVSLAAADVEETLQPRPVAAEAADPTGAARLRVRRRDELRTDAGAEAQFGDRHRGRVCAEVRLHRHRPGSPPHPQRRHRVERQQLPRRSPREEVGGRDAVEGERRAARGEAAERDAVRPPRHAEVVVERARQPANERSCVVDRPPRRDAGHDAPRLRLREPDHRRVATLGHGVRRGCQRIGRSRDRVGGYRQRVGHLRVGRCGKDDEGKEREEEGWKMKGGRWRALLHPRSSILDPLAPHPVISGNSP